MSNPTHPKCGKTFPGGTQAGHCATCCETFIGAVAFDAHRIGQQGIDRRCEIRPYDTQRTENGNISYGHWQDDRGYWHYGKKLTDDEKTAIFGRKS